MGTKRIHNSVNVLTPGGKNTMPTLMAKLNPIEEIIYGFWQSRVTKGAPAAKT